MAYYDENSKWPYLEINMAPADEDKDYQYEVINKFYNTGFIFFMRINNKTHDVHSGLDKAGVEKVYLEIRNKLTDPCGWEPMKFPDAVPEPKRFDSHLPKDL